jgi:hypothetical protein
LKPYTRNHNVHHHRETQGITDFKRENNIAMTFELVTISKPKTKQENPKNHRSQISRNPKVEITHSVHHHHREAKGYADFSTRSLKQAL